MHLAIVLKFYNKLLKTKKLSVLPNSDFQYSMQVNCLHLWYHEYTSKSLVPLLYPNHHT